MAYDLSRQLALQKIVADISRRFIQVEDLDSSIHFALSALGSYSQASRAYIFKVDMARGNMDNTYEWCQEGVMPEIDNLQGLPTDIFPWWMDTLSQGRIINVLHVSDLGPEAEAERDILSAQGIESVLVLPIIYGGRLQAYIGFDHVDTSHAFLREDEDILAIAAELFSSVFDRVEKQTKYQEAHEALKESMATLEAAELKIRQQEQKVAIGQLAAGMAHEINNPLAYISANREFMKEYVDDLYQMVLDPPRQVDREALKEDYEEMQDIFYDTKTGLDRVMRIVKSLRFFVEDYEEKTMVLYNFKESIPHTLNLLSSRLNHQVQVDVDIDEAHSTIYANNYQMNEVLLQVITNALDAMEDQACQPKLTVRVYGQDDQVIVAIRDKGPGMTEEVMQRVFNPFFTTKKAHVNQGLGLNMVYDIIKNNHKGDIEIESSVDRGTQVKLILPREID